MAVLLRASCRRLIASRQMLDDVLTVALHPSGIMLLVGCHDGLRLMHIALVRVGCIMQCRTCRLMHTLTPLFHQQTANRQPTHL